MTVPDHDASPQGHIESIGRDPDRRSFLNSVFSVKPAFHTLLRTKTEVGFVRQSKLSAERDSRKKGAS